MIWESGPWKDELLKDAEMLNRWSANKKRIAKRELIFEKKLFLSAYVIRKLFEAEKVCTEVPEKVILCETYSRTSSVMTPLNWHRIDEHFELQRSSIASLSYKALVNQIVHSHIFMLQVDEEDVVNGFLVSSKQGKQQRLFGVSLSSFIELMREIGTDDPSRIRTKKDVSTGKYVVIKTCEVHSGSKDYLDDFFP
ncbi:hypothetical protein [Azospirillum oryzae]|uniref:hypothetical protein n=1 Tax=Azospirillum oryzae TaxID=286727 RepID=UPI0011779C4C|nr:hypothetical protein [Azospirillum oryzae]